MSFPTSSIPAILFWNFADNALQVTSPKAPFCVQNFFLEAPSLQLGRERYTATTLWCSMAKATVAVVSRHELSPRLARQCGSQEKQRVQANGSNLQVLLNKVRTLGCKSSLKHQTQGLLEGDRWVEGEVLYSRSTTTCLRVQLFLSLLRCSLAWINVFRAPGPTNAAFHSCRSAQKHFFFCSTNVRQAKTNVCDRSKRTFTERSVDSFQL